MHDGITDRAGTTITRAAVMRGPGEPFSLEQVQLPPLEADGVLVRIRGTGMCQTDLLARNGEGPWPMVLGHEGAGVVEAVGDAVAGVAVGDHVVLTFDSCGVCRACRAEQPAYCEEFSARNIAGVAPGRAEARDAGGERLASHWFGQSSFAGYAIATARNAVVIDRDFPLELAGPLGCGVQTGAGAILNVLRPEPGDSLVVFGAGGVGLSAILAARAAGVTSIVAVEPRAERRELALELGASDAFGPDDRERLHERKGALDHALDTTGDTAAIRSALDLLRARGRCGLVSWSTVRPVLGARDLVMRGITVTGILEGSADPHAFIPALIELWREGRFPFERMLRTFPLDEINAAEQAMQSGEVVKAVLLPTGG